MTKILAIIGARLNSSRLPGKHLLPLPCDDRGNSQPLISHILARLKQSNLITDIELATTADDFNQPLVKWAQEQKLTCFPFKGDVNNLMARLDDIIQKRTPDVIVYICGDCPLIDPEFIDHALANLVASGRDSIKLLDEVRSLHEGMAFYSKTGWDKLMSVSLCAMSKEHVGYADRITPVLETLKITDSADYSKLKHRISVDTYADYRFMAEVYRRWYLSHSATSVVNLQWVQQQLICDPALAAINSHVQQKAADITYAKVSLYCHVSKVIGTGHLKRCAMIADVLQDKLGLGTQIYVQGEEVSFPWLRTTTVWLGNNSQLLHKMQQDDNSLLILDFHPNFIDLKTIASVCTEVRRHGRKILAIDKLVDILESVDKLFIPSFFTPKHDPKISFGWQNYLLENKASWPKKQQVLILTGGSDALDYGQSLPELLENSLKSDWEYIWIRGPLAAEPKMSTASKIKILHNPTELPQLIAESSVILSCYGLSLFESIASQAATVLLPVKHLCEPAELDSLASYNLCLLSSNLTEAVNQLLRLQESETLRADLQKNAAKVFSNEPGLNHLTEIVKALLA